MKRWLPFCLFLLLNIPAVAQLQLVLPAGHTDAVKQASFTPDLKKLITLSADKSMAVWDADNGLLIRKLFTGKACIMFSLLADGKTMAVLDFETEPKIVEISSGLVKATLKGHTLPPNVIATDRQGNYWATAAWDKTARIWDARTYKQLQAFNNEITNFTRLHFSPDGRRLLLATKDSLFIREVVSGKPVHTLGGPLKPVEEAFSPDGKRLAVAFADGSVRIYDTGNWSSFIQVKKTSPTIGILQFNHNGSLLMTGDSGGGPVELWQANDGSFRLQIGKEDEKRFWLAVFNPHDNRILTSSNEIRDVAMIWDGETGKLLQHLKPVPNRMVLGQEASCVSFSPKGDRCFVATTKGVGKMYQASQGALLFNMAGHTGPLTGIAVNTLCHKILTNGYQVSVLDQSTLEPAPQYAGSSGNIKAVFIGDSSLFSLSSTGSGSLWNLVTGMPVKTFPAKRNTGALAVSQGGKQLALLSGYFDIDMIDLAKDTLQTLSAIESRGQVQTCLSYNGDFLAMLSYTDTLNVWNVARAKLVGRIKKTNPAFSGLPEFDTSSVHPKMFYAGEDKTKLIVRDAATGKVLYDIETGDRLLSACFTPGGQQIITSGSYRCKVWDAGTGKGLYELNGYGPVLQFEGDKVVSVSLAPGADTSVVWVSSLSSGARLHSFSLPPFTVARYIDFSRNVLYAGNGTELQLYDYNSGKLIVRHIPIDESGYLDLLPSGYYKGTPAAAASLHYVTADSRIVTFDQQDIKYNRPDLVLEAIGHADTSLIRSYRRAYEKRLRKLGVDTASFREELSLPEVSILHRDTIRYERGTDLLKLHIRGDGVASRLDMFNIWVNDVPVFGSRGYSLRHLRKKIFDTTLVIRLSEGENRIETTVRNNKGTESYRMPLYVKYAPAVPVKSRTYFIGIGIDRFADSSHNLHWSVKDIRDLAAALKAQYEDDFIVLDTLFNEKVTARNIAAIKDGLKDATVNDRVILSYSGHGLLSDSLDYYLSTYDVNFKKPEEKGLSYEALQNLLDSIAPRRKLMLLDACHSGEVDKEERSRINAAAGALARNGVKASFARGAEVTSNDTTAHVGMNNSFELMQALFANIGAGTGSTIIAASGGSQFAYESGDVGNGVFTYCLLQLLDQRRTIKMSELQKIVSERVLEMTNGLQRPAVRNGVLYNDWSL